MAKTFLNPDSILDYSIDSSKLKEDTFKTINGESLLGEGDIEVSGGVDIVDSIDSLDSNAEQGSLAVVRGEKKTGYSIKDSYVGNKNPVVINEFKVTTPTALDYNYDLNLMHIFSKPGTSDEEIFSGASENYYGVVAGINEGVQLLGVWGPVFGEGELLLHDSNGINQDALARLNSYIAEWGGVVFNGTISHNDEGVGEGFKEPEDYSALDAFLTYELHSLKDSFCLNEEPEFITGLNISIPDEFYYTGLLDFVIAPKGYNSVEELINSQGFVVCTYDYKSESNTYLIAGFDPKTEQEYSLVTDGIIDQQAVLDFNSILPTLGDNLVFYFTTDEVTLEEPSPEQYACIDSILKNRVKTLKSIPTTNLYIKDYDGWKKFSSGNSSGGGITIVDSVDKLDPNAPLGSLASVLENEKIGEEKYYVNEIKENELPLYRVALPETNNPYVLAVGNFSLRLQSADGDIIRIELGAPYGYNSSRFGALAWALNSNPNPQNDRSNTICEYTTTPFGITDENYTALDRLNQILSDKEFFVTYGYSVGKYGLPDANTCIDTYVEKYTKISKLFIKNEAGWEELKTGGSAETVDNLEDTSTDKALSANMGRVLNERISAVASGSVTSVAGTLNIKDLNAVKAAQELLSNNQQVTYIITDSNGNYPSPNNSTVYIDTEDHILDILYRGNGDALKWLLKNKQAYYNYSGSWYSQTISGDLVKLPSLHLRTAQVGDLITLIRQDIPAEEFYSNFVDYNNINLNLGTSEKLVFDSYLTLVGVKGALESISDGEAIRRLVEGGYIYSSEGDPNKGYTTNKLVSDEGLVTLYTAQITPNTQHLYNGEFWTGNMTGPGIYSYITAGRPAGSEDGEYYIGYVSPNGVQSLVSMLNPYKVFVRPSINDEWVNIAEQIFGDIFHQIDEISSKRFPSIPGWLVDVDNCLDNGVHPTCSTQSILNPSRSSISAPSDLKWTTNYFTCLVNRTSTNDGTYDTIEQTAYGRGTDAGQIYKRIIFHGPDTQYGPWINIVSGGTGTYPEINHGTSDTTFTLTPNTFHIWGEVPSLDISFEPEIEGIANEYIFQFSSGSTPTTLNINENIKWADLPNMSANKTYQISVLKGLASIIEFS